MSHSELTYIFTIRIVSHIFCVATAHITQLCVYVHEYSFLTLRSGSFDRSSFCLTVPCDEESLLCWGGGGKGRFTDAQPFLLELTGINASLEATQNQPAPSFTG